ncbi:MAG: AAA family ATPase [Candidatus Pacebacteria bacterium]|jgi:chromosome partitioning protein|nr:AAA family ATPase [Candidatus Paceibacterota bacterium]NMB47383.1 ParA family protein [Patescibacteria group bacterium]MDD2796388.1 AAA family ATPase [Candidatus Paceibacterota bacterium]MDD3048078.1 AAA family ATPase [Candidatus Paceibacterota bacterium]MDD3509831.1 AAA family ATPase [Candidatus Paceibacterota bacterium]
MTRVIAVANQKGGVGKTSIAVNLPVFLTAYGKRVLLVDFDSQANATFSLGIDPNTLRKSVYEAILGEVHPQEVIKRTVFLGYDVLPTSHDLAGAAVELVNMKDREYRLKKVIDSVKNNYDLVFIDCPPSLGLPTLNALVAADDVIIPVQAEFLSIEGLSQLLSNIKLINENLDRDIQIMGAVLTMYLRRNKVSQEVEKELRRNFEDYVFDAIIPRATVLAESPRYGRTILRHAPNSKAVNAFRELAEEFIRKL